MRYTIWRFRCWKLPKTTSSSPSATESSRTREVGLLLDKICLHDALIEDEDVWICRIDFHVEPVIVEFAKSFHAREVLNSPPADRTDHRLINSKVMRIAVHQDDRLCKADRFLLEPRKKIIEAGSSRVCRSQIEVGIRLNNDHHRFGIPRRRQLKRFAEPHQIGLIAFCV